MSPVMELPNGELFVLSRRSNWWSRRATLTHKGKAKGPCKPRDERYWLDRAEAARLNAAEMKSRSASALLLRLAEEYEERAERAKVQTGVRRRGR